MKKLYTAPQSEKVNLDPLMVSFGDSNPISIVKDPLIGEGD